LPFLAVILLEPFLLPRRVALRGRDMHSMLEALKRPSNATGVQYRQILVLDLVV
jgi:hypothetical protein